jgi:exodeoxyribonuclease VII small subunit
MNSPGDSPSFEAALASLEAIVHDLEDGDLGLAEALARYEQGVKHLRHCYELLEQAERRIEQLTGVDADGRAKTAPFAEQKSEVEAQSSEPAAAKRATNRTTARKPRRMLLDLDDEESLDEETE